MARDLNEIRARLDRCRMAVGFGFGPLIFAELVADVEHLLALVETPTPVYGPGDKVLVDGCGNKPYTVKSACRTDDYVIYGFPTLVHISALSAYPKDETQ